MSKLCRVKFQYDSQNPDSELSIAPEEILTVLQDDGDWWLCQNQSGKKGYIPSNYVELTANTQQAAPAPAMMQASHTMQPGPGGAASSGNTEWCLAIHDYAATRQDELTLTQNLRIEVLSKSDDGWWMGRANGVDGWFPANFVKEEASNQASNGPSQLNNDLAGLGDIFANSNNNSKPSMSSTNSKPSDVLHIVKAIFKFEGQDGEISLTPDMRLEIIEKPDNSSGWWRARNPQTGQVGLIPENHVEVVHDDSHPNSQGHSGGMFQASGNEGNISGKPYFKGKMKRIEGEQMLRMAHVGQYLVRESESSPIANTYSISVKGAQKIRHFSTTYNPGDGWKIGPKKFRTFDELIDHYTRLPIFVDNTERLNLTNHI